MSRWLERMFYEPKAGLLLSSLSQVLTPVGQVYGWVARSQLTERRTSNNGYRAKVPVLSVGNYVVGGGGKTPMVIWLAQYFKAQSLKPAILIRGYGASGVPQRIKGKLNDAMREAVGDEATLISETLIDVPVFVGADRVKHAKEAEKEADILILDDGLQHAALYRDWDVVCFKGAYPVGNGRCLPAGPLREPLPYEQPDKSTWLHYISDLEQLWSRANAAVALEILNIANADGEILEKSQVLHLLCGVARPEQVRTTLEQDGWNVPLMNALSDHEPISAGRLQTFIKHAESDGAVLVITEKDAARLPHALLSSKNIFKINTALKWHKMQERNSFCEILDQIAAVSRS